MRERSARRERLGVTLWFLPAVVATACFVAALVLTELDRLLQRYDAGSALQGYLARSPQAADTILGVIAGSMLSLTVLVFSITVLVLQLASSQFAAGTVHRFFRDRSTKFALGLFLGTFLFALTGIRAVNFGVYGRQAFVPGLVVTAAFALVVASLGVFLHYLHHVTTAIRADSMIAAIAEETAAMIDRLDPLPAGAIRVGQAPPPQLRGHPLLVASPRSGYVTSVETAALLASAAAADVFIAAPALGEFIARDDVLLRVFGRPTTPLRDLVSAVALANEPSVDRDIAYGLRQLADIGWRALSASGADPSVAHAVLDRMYELLARLGAKALGENVVRDEAGRVRLLIEATSWEEYLQVALGDLAKGAEAVPSAATRLAKTLRRLERTLPPERVAALVPYRR